MDIHIVANDILVGATTDGSSSISRASLGGSLQRMGFVDSGSRISNSLLSLCSWMNGATVDDVPHLVVCY